MQKANCQPLSQVHCFELTNKKLIWFLWNFRLLDDQRIVLWFCQVIPGYLVCSWDQEPILLGKGRLLWRLIVLVIKRGWVYEERKAVSPTHSPQTRPFFQPLSNLCGSKESCVDGWMAGIGGRAGGSDYWNGFVRYSFESRPTPCGHTATAGFMQDDEKLLI